MFEARAGHATATGKLQDRILTLKIAGTMTDSGFSELESPALSAVDREDWNAVILDLSSADRTCSILLRMMVRIQKLADLRNATFVTVAPAGGPVAERLYLSKMDGIVRIVPDMAAARQLTEPDGSSNS